MNLKQVGRMLKGWGYTPQKPVRKAFEQESQVVAQRLNKGFVQLKRKAANKRFCANLITAMSSKGDLEFEIMQG